MINCIQYRLEEKRKRKTRKLNGLLEEWECLQMGAYVRMFLPVYFTNNKKKRKKNCMRIKV